MNFKDKRCLVTGGTGFIGSHLCEELLAQGAMVFAFDNFFASSIDNIKHLGGGKFGFINKDIKDYNAVRSAVSRSDYVFHLAATNVGHSTTDPRNDMETNIGGTLNVLLAIKENPQVRMVHVSSGSVLGSGELPMLEDSILKPTTPYGISKMAGEKYAEFFAKEYKLPISIIRYFHVFGPRQDMNGTFGVINIFLSRILKGLPPVVWGDGSQVKCFTYVKDSVKATLTLAQDGSTIGQIYNCASDTVISIKDLAELLIAKYAKDKTMKPVFANPKIGENMRPVPDVTKLKNLGFKTDYTLEQGLDLAKEWVEKQL